MGITLGVIGAGGSILTVPILAYLFGVNPTLATAYSLALVGATAATGGLRHFLRGDVDVEAVLTFGLPSMIGVYLARRYGLPMVPEVVGTMGSFQVTRDLLIMLVFAVFMLAAAMFMIRGRAGSSEKPRRKLTTGGVVLAGCEGLVVGGITGLVGAGGGFLIVPALVWLLGLPIKRAVTTSLTIIAIKSLIGFTGDLQGPQQIDWRFLLSLFGLSAVGILMGIRVGQNLQARHLQRGFGWFVLVTGVFVIARELSR